MVGKNQQKSAGRSLGYVKMGQMRRILHIVMDAFFSLPFEVSKLSFKRHFPFFFFPLRSLTMYQGSML